MRLFCKTNISMRAALQSVFPRVRFVFIYWLTWVAFFELCRLLFIASNYKQVKEAGAAEVAKSLLYGLRMDFSAAAYITVLVALAVSLSVYSSFFRKANFYQVYTAVVLLLVLLIVFADVGLFKAWGYRVDATVLKYFANPKEVWASVSHLPIAGISLLWLVLYASLLLVFRHLLRKQLPLLSGNYLRVVSFLTVLGLTASLILPIRGGVQLAPLNQSSVYYSQNNFANMAALNASWNLLRSASRKGNNSVNPFIVADAKQVEAVVDSLLQKSSSAEELLLQTNDSTPTNVILIVWESFTSKAINLNVEGKAITPGFNQLIKEGIYFSNIYATGDRTDKGIVGILSGYPAQPTTSIVKEPVKASSLPMLSTSFKDHGYHTAFFYGGELEFANMKAYLLQGKYDQFTTINDFEKKDQNSKWGAHDAVVADRLKSYLQEVQQPFFTTWLTLSSHEPYEIPATPLLSGEDDEAKFLSSLNYSDQVVGDFVQFAKTQNWWSNTLIVIVADHGHRLPVSTDKAKDFHIPILMLGGVVKRPFKSIDSVGSQTDVAATILQQLNMPADNFTWSRSLMQAGRMPWAYFTFNNGFGWVQPQKIMVWDNVGNRTIQQSGNISPSDVYSGRAMQQAAFQDFLDR
ncbi:MAG: alkaline phosphatase family protein [Chitinophagaceae bacterium]|nr:MAG: alkaline phosphatase family protein [Chitinophagaceae bacterium]